MRSRTGLLGFAILIITTLVSTTACLSNLGGLSEEEYEVEVEFQNVGQGSGLLEALNVTAARSDQERCQVSRAATCTIKFQDWGGGGSFAVLAPPDRDADFAQWETGPCSGSSPTCTLSFTTTPAHFKVDIRFRPSFVLTGDPAISLGIGAPASTSILITRSAAFTDPVTLVVAGAPPGMNVTPTRNGSSGDPRTETWTLAVDADTRVAPGRHPIDIRAEAATTSRTHRLTADVSGVPPARDFTVRPPAGAVALGAGNDIGLTIGITRTGNGIGPVDLDAQQLPGGVTASWSDDPATGATSTLTLSAVAAPLTSSAQGTLRIVGTAGQLRRTADFAFSLTPATLILTPSVANVTLPPGTSANLSLQLIRSAAAIGPVEIRASSSGPITIGGTGQVPASSSTANLSVSSVAGAAPGSYQLQLTGTGAQGITGSANVTVTVPGTPSAQPTLAAGWNSACGLTANGTAYCWGVGIDGAIGDGGRANQLSPVPVSGGHAFKRLGVGGNHACGMLANGAAYCWGDNSSGELGNGTQSRGLVRMAVTGGLSFATIAAGEGGTCAATPAGQAYCWGIEPRRSGGRWVDWLESAGAHGGRWQRRLRLPDVRIFLRLRGHPRRCRLLLGRQPGPAG